MDTSDIAVIGAGAAGLAAAIFAADFAPDLGAEGDAAHVAGAPRRHIVVLDGAASVGAKMLISGGGRCNVTHAEVSPADFNGTRHIVRNVLSAFDVPATRRWFASFGVELKQEKTGKLFPVTDRARTVLDALLRRCAALEVEVRPGHRVHAVRRAEEGFAVEHAHGVLCAGRLIVATGGRSLPRTGSDGAGWELLRLLGHHVTDTHPALVPLVLGAGMSHAELSGISQEVELSTFAGGKRIDRRCGSLLWTHFGISGPVVLDASRHWVVARAQGQQPEMRCNFLPGLSAEAAQAWLRDVAAQHPRASVGRCLARRLPERFAALLARRAGCEPGGQIAQLTRPHRHALAQALTATPLPVERDRGWSFAEVTAGGVPLREIDYRTMESRLVPDLYLVGELLDCDGRIGGFNFQWAWSTGYLAGRAARRSGSQDPFLHGVDR